MKRAFTYLYIIALIACSVTIGHAQKTHGDVQAAIDAATAGGTVTLEAGIYVFNAGVNVNKAVTITGAGSGSTIIQVSGTGYRFDITAPGVTIQDVQIQKTDKAGVQNIIHVGANNFTLKNSIVCGQYVHGDADVSRALEFSGGFSGILIEGNTFYSLRQPGYINGPLQGEIKNNLIHSTRGWLVAGGSLTFTGNAWGSGAQSNVYDIAIISSTPSSDYADIVAVSSANYGAVIEDQRVTPAVLSHVYVDDDASFSIDLGGKYHPYSSIVPALTRVASGGTIHVANGTYPLTATLTLNKPMTIIGESEAGVIIDASALPETAWGINPNKSNTTLSTMTIIPKATNGGYAIHAGDNLVPVVISNLSLDHITVNGAYRTPFDFNGVTNLSVHHLTATNSAHGNGIQFSGCTNVTADHLTTSGNAWGGLAVYVSRSAPNGVGRGSDAVAINGTSCTFGEANKVYSQDEYGFVNTNLNVNGFDYFVQNPVSETGKGFYQIDKPAAITFALALTSPGKSSVKQRSTGQYFVEPGLSIQAAVDAAAAGATVNVAAGLYAEGVIVNKALTLLGAGRAVTTIWGPKTAAQTVLLSGSNILFDGFSVKREGNTVADWPDGVNLNVSGIGFGQLNTGVTVQNCLITECRNGIYMNNTQSHSIRNNIITNNRTGLQLVNNVSGCVVENNEITNNWTLGVVVYYASPSMPVSAGVMVNHNTITGNWYGCVESKSVAGYPPNPTERYNFENNWFGTSTPTVTTALAGEPGYNALIPVAFGGTSVNPGSNEGKISGDLSGLIDYDPWVGMAQTITYASLNTPISFDQAKTTLTFTQLPNPTNATVSVTRSTTQPAGTPPPPANGGTTIPLYLDFSVTGLGNPFSLTITIDVTDVSNISDSTIVMFYNNSTGNWIALGNAGTYNASAHTYTFTTNHFTTFSFVNPGNPVDLYLTTSNTDVTQSVVYPHVGMGKALTVADDGFSWTPVSPDWTYKLDSLILYVVPTGTQPIIAANFKVKWDPAKLSLGSVTKGTFFANSAFNTTSVSGEVLIHTANTASTINVTPSSGVYLARLAFVQKAIGAGTVSIDDVDFRYYDNGNDQQQSVIVTPHNASMKLYLGDFAKTEVPPGPATLVTGDGLINFTDLVPFAAAYWKQQPATGYMSKYDVGPTNASGSYFAMPKPDGKIEFEDLVIFSIGYGKSASSQLPKRQTASAVFALERAELSGGEMRVPLMVRGGIDDLRAFSLVMSSTAQFLRVEKAGRLDSPDGFAIAKQENGRIFLDAAIIGAEKSAITQEGVVAYLVLQGKGGVALSESKARDSRNNELATLAAGSAFADVPETFAVSQNYPNPFNPSTVISYQLPKQSMVTVSIFNALGQRVATLVNEVKDAGYYDVSWNAAEMASGMYFCHITAGDANITKKMILMK